MITGKGVLSGARGQRAIHARAPPMRVAPIGCAEQRQVACSGTKYELDECSIWNYFPLGDAATCFMYSAGEYESPTGEVTGYFAGPDSS